MSPRRLGAIFRKEGLHILRDPRSLAAALLVPVVMLLLFGYALTLDVDRVPTAVHDLDRSPASRALIERFRGSRYFTVIQQEGGYAAIEEDIDQSRLLLGVVIPENFSEHLARGEEAQVQLLLDGSDSNTAALAAGYAESLVLAYSADRRDQALRARGMKEIEMPLDARVRVLYNHELKSKNFIIPGLIAVILMIISALLTSLTIAREWETGTMEQLLSTPVRPAELLLGKLMAYFVLGMADMAVALVLGLGLFGVPLNGSFWLLVFFSALFLFGALCWGILISTVARSQLLAFQASMVSSFLPAFLLSGFMYAIENMPLIVQQVTRIVPARYFVTALQGIFLKGVGMEVLWKEALFLFIYAGLVFALAARKMRQKMA